MGKHHCRRLQEAWDRYTKIELCIFGIVPIPELASAEASVYEHLRDRRPGLLLNDKKIPYDHVGIRTARARTLYKSRAVP